MSKIIQVGEKPFDELTTGGSSGAPLIFPISEAERDYVQRFGHQAQASFNRQNKRKRALFLKGGTQLQSVGTPSMMRRHPVYIYDHGSFDHARRILLRTHKEPRVDSRCTVLTGDEMLVRAFTLDCEARGFDLDGSRIVLIITYGDILTSRWRQKYKDYWGCALVDRYGLTETYGGATQDIGSGFYLFDPQCFAEVVVPYGSERIIEGLGELVLTPLFPFQQALPLVRYRTGDLVLVTHRVPRHVGVPAIRPMGRLREAIQIGVQELIPGIVFYNAVDRFPDVIRTEHFNDAHQLTVRRLIGRPRFLVESLPANRKIRLSVETESSVPLQRDAVSVLEQMVAEEHLTLTGAKWPDGLKIEV